MTMRKIFTIVLTLILVLGGIYLYKHEKKNPQAKPDQSIQTQQSESKSKAATSTKETTITSTTTPASKAKLYTMEEVASHGADPNSDECWTVIHDKVYNIIDFLQIHPGGEQISQICGKDGTSLFETRPTGSRTPHSPAARKILDKYYIGDLKK